MESGLGCKMESAVAMHQVMEQEKELGKSMELTALREQGSQDGKVEVEGVGGPRCQANQKHWENSPCPCCCVY